MLLVQLNLGRGGSRGLSETLSHVLKLASQVGPLALGLGASLPLGLQLLLGPLLVGNGLLGDLQLSLNLPPLLLNVGAATLLLLQRGLQLIQGALKLALDLVEMSHLVLGSGQILSGLGCVLADVLLLLVQLVDHLVLVGDLVVQAADGVITVGLLLLDLLDGHLDIVNVLLHSGALLLQQLFLGQGILTGSLLGNEGILGVGQVHLQAGDGSGGLGLLVVVDREVALLLLQLSQKGLLLLLDGDVLLKKTVLGLQLLVVLAPGGVSLGLKLLQLLLGVGQADQAPGLLDDDEPSPVPHAEELPKVPLGNLDQLPLVELLLVDSSTDPLEGLSLDEPDPLDDQLVTLLLKSTKGSSAEEDEGVAEPVPLAVEGNAVHEGIDSRLVVGGGLDGVLAQARVAKLEVGVEHPVGESTHADPDALEHTVASQLVHDQWGLHLAGLLVGVGHKATHKVGLARVEGGHQLNQGDQVDGGDSLAATLLLLLALLLGSGGGLARVVFPEENQQGVSGLALHDLDHRVVDGVLVLLKPSSDIVRHDTGVVGDGKVGVLVSL